MYLRHIKPNHWSMLPKEEVIKAIERRYPVRIPLVRARWWGEGLVEQYGERLGELDRYPEDAVILFNDPIDYSKLGLSWNIDTDGAHDSRVILPEWEKLEEFINKLPDPEQDTRFDLLAEQAEKIRQEGAYLMFGWWRLFFERPWGIRGMTNLLMDYYTAPEKVHILHDALCSLYLGYLKRAVREIQPDGFWTSDDLGHQTQLFMRPSTFRSLLKPYYSRIGRFLKENHLHWWLHSCGNNTEIMDDLIEVGVNVFHPVQKGTMDEVGIARDYGDRLAFLAGIDVQHTLQEKTPEGVRREVQFLIDTFDRPEGGLCIAAGNGIVAGTPFECIEAFLDEAVQYGAEHRRRFNP
ncbi:MAG TPA: uroporphyrinogen decarboxylase family protein [Anaerolineaceae bacterium]